MTEDLPVGFGLFLVGNGITGPSDSLSGGAGFFMASYWGRQLTTGLPLPLRGHGGKEK